MVQRGEMVLNKLEGVIFNSHRKTWLSSLLYSNFAMSDSSFKVVNERIEKQTENCVYCVLAGAHVATGKLVDCESGVYGIIHPRQEHSESFASQHHALHGRT